ncbi:HD domain-containing protein [bacterium]|nr:MAG: HD domain-containing protein [bacterium]
MPAKNQFIAKLHEDTELHDTFLVLQKQLSPTRQGRNYLRVTLGDKTGQLEARVWEGAEELVNRFDAGDLVYVTGMVTSYNGVLQIKAQFIEKLPEGKVEWADYLPSSSRPAQEMVAELRSLLGTIANPHLLALVNSFLEDAPFMERFSVTPAAKGMHHAFVGGLLEHTLGVVKISSAMSVLYPVSRDALLTGAFLHDIGKIEELTASAGFDYTMEGKLIGHLIIGRDMLKERAAKVPGFPENLLLHLEHMILSHHGELEWGSPKRPKTVESLALHLADNLDAKLMAAIESVSKSDGMSGDWTAFLKIFDRPFLRSSLLEADSPDKAKKLPTPKAAKEPAKEQEQQPKPPSPQRTLF